MADGNILLVGGENGTFSDPNGTVYLTDGKKSQRVFQVCKEGDKQCTSSAWKMMPKMTTERWYPTVTTLGDGSTIIVGGSTGSFAIVDLTEPRKAVLDNPTYEYYPPKTTGVWPRPMEILKNVFPYVLYSPTFQLPNGKVFIFVSNKTSLLDPLTEAVDDTSISPILIDDKQPWIYPYTPTAVMLPLTIENNYTPTIQVCGGSRKSTNISDSRCIALNFGESSPQWKLTDPMPIGRIMPDSVLLPDGTILYTNGGDRGMAGGNAGQMDGGIGVIMNPVFRNYIFDPRKPSGSRWTEVAPASVPRLYHSGALLLPDGRVLTMGSEEQNYVDVIAGRRDCMPFVEKACTSPFETRVEAYEPSYLSLPQARPVITAVKSSMTYGSTFEVSVSSNGLDVDYASFIRYSTVTHSTNTDQRFLQLKILGREAGKVYLAAPANGNLAPPGNWMLFLMNKGKPSIASTILLGPGAVENIAIPDSARSAVPSGKKNSSSKGEFSGIFSRWELATLFAILAAGLVF